MELSWQQMVTEVHTFSKNSVQDTGGGDTNPWWRVTVYTITSVRILNRGIDAGGGKYFNEVTFTTVLLCVVSLYEGVTSAVVPGERYRGPVVRVLEIIGQQQCVRECRHRPKLCRGVNYRKQELLCELVSAIDKTETNPDYIRIELNQTVNVPEMNQECLACSSDDQCVTLSSKKVHCIRVKLKQDG
nr:uncharacterized protein LOC117685905 [Crassostrea gigas]